MKGTSRVAAHLLALGLMVALCACPKGDTEAEGAAASASSAEPAPPGALIELEGRVVRLDGAEAGGTHEVEDTGRMAKIDALFDALRKQREAFKEKNPTTEFPGQAVIRCDPEAKAIVFKSLFQTTALAGYPNLTVATHPGYVEIQPVLPGPPPALGDAGAGKPPLELHVHLEQERVVLLQKQGRVVMTESVVPEAATSPDALTAAVVKHFGERDMRAAGPPVVVVHADNMLDFGRVAGALRAADAAHGKLDKGTERAFTLVFSVGSDSRYSVGLAGVDPFVFGNGGLGRPAIDSPPGSGLGLDPPGGLWGPSRDGGVPAPRVRGSASVKGRLPPEVVQRIVRHHFGRFRTCYQAALDRTPGLEGRVRVRFVIARDGKVSNAVGDGDLPDPAVIKCVVNEFYHLSFPPPEGGVVTVEYPIVFSPGG